MRVELRAPAGDFKTALAAFEAGADAVYCGLADFSARAFAVNFTMDDLAMLLRYSRAKGKKVYVAFNTLVDEDDFEPAARVLSRLAERGIDYLALGHYHLHRVTSLDTRGVCAYSGTPEGRGMDEAGECGVLLIDTAESPIRPRFIKTARRTIHRFPVEVTADAAETERRVRDALAGIPREDIVRIELSGRIPPDAPRPNAERIVDIFGHNYFYLEVRDHTRLDIRPEQYADSLTLKGEFVRRVMAAGLSEAEQDAILQAGLAALRGEEDEV